MVENETTASILTDAQRAFLESLLAGEEGDKDQKRAMRGRIRDRILASFGDFPLIFDALLERDRDQILEGGRNQRAKLYDGIVAALAFLFELAEELEWDFEHLLKEAVDEVYSHPTRRESPRGVESVTFEARPKKNPNRFEAYDRALMKWERGNVLSITDGELRAAHDVGEEGTVMQLSKAYREARRERGAIEGTPDEWAERIRKREKMIGESKE